MALLLHCYYYVTSSGKLGNMSYVTDKCLILLLAGLNTTGNSRSGIITWNNSSMHQVHAIVRSDMQLNHSNSCYEVCFPPRSHVQSTAKANNYVTFWKRCQNVSLRKLWTKSLCNQAIDIRPRW